MSDETFEGADGKPVSIDNIRELATNLKDKDAAMRAGHVSKDPLPGLPLLLNSRRVEMGIPDELFSVECVYDRVFVYQISDKADSYELAAGEILLEKTDQTLDRERIQSPRGIIVSAGLGARDSLVSNGMDLGHIVRFTQNVPFRMEMAFAGGITVAVLMMRAGDICGSEDLRRALAARKVHIKATERVVDGVTVREHVYVDEDGKTWNPQTPWIGDDF